MPRIDVEVRDDTLKIGPRFSVSFMRTLRIPAEVARITHCRPRSAPSRSIGSSADFRRPCAARVARAGRRLHPALPARSPLAQLPGARLGHPVAVRVGIGKVDALAGEPLATLRSDAGSRRTISSRRSSPGWMASTRAKTAIRQFVAMPLGQGYTVEAQVTGEEVFGGIQLVSFEPKPDRFPEPPPRCTRTARRSSTRSPPPRPQSGGRARHRRVGVDAAPARRHRDGPRRGRSHGAEALPGPVRRRRVGHRRVRPLLRPHRQQRDRGGRSPASRCRRHPSRPTPTRRTATRGSASTTSTSEDLPASKTLGAVKSVDELDPHKVSDGTW